MGAPAAIDPQVQYPVGRFCRTEIITPECRADAIAALAALPERLTAALAGLTDAQLDTPYREGGWSPRQIAHHLADSHMNAYVRFKMAYTEDWPIIKCYCEDIWAKLPDYRLPVAPSLDLLTALHHRWVELLKTFDEAGWTRHGYVHPEYKMRSSLDEVVQIYAWHSVHHVAHITGLRERCGW